MGMDAYNALSLVGGLILWLWFGFEVVRRVALNKAPGSALGKALSDPLLGDVQHGKNDSPRNGALLRNTVEERNISREEGGPFDASRSTRGRQGTVTVHFAFFKAGDHTSIPLRQWMIGTQILIQFVTAVTTRDEIGVIIGDGSNGWLGHGLKMFTWLLALIADIIRGSGNPRASPMLPLATAFLATSATSGLEWPPDPQSSTPVFALLDVVFLFSFFLCTAWSAVGCMHLAETGGLKLPEQEESGNPNRRRSV